MSQRTATNGGETGRRTEQVQWGRRLLRDTAYGRKGTVSPCSDERQASSYDGADYPGGPVVAEAVQRTVVTYTGRWQSADQPHTGSDLMAAAHILVVHRHDDSDDVDATVECPGVSDSCRLWIECAVCCAETREVQARVHELCDDGEQHEIHGVLHIRGEGTVWAYTHRCLSDYDGATDSIADTAANLPSGRYPVDVNYLGDGDVEIELIGPAASIEKEPAHA